MKGPRFGGSCKSEDQQQSRLWCGYDVGGVAAMELDLLPQSAQELPHWLVLRQRRRLPLQY